MDRVLSFLKVFITFWVLIISSCKTKNPTELKIIFEKAPISDSVPYYFPSILNDTFQRQKGWAKNFSQRWYSSNLYSFKEPILYNKTDSQTIYRVLWLRSFNEPVCFTVKENNGSYFLNTKTLDRHPEFDYTIESKGIDKTGKEIKDTIHKPDQLAIIAFDSIITLSGNQWKEIENYLKDLNFWDSPVADPNDQHSTDGANWIIEGRNNGSYHFIDRRNDNSELNPLGKYLIKLSGLNINEKYIY